MSRVAPTAAQVRRRPWLVLAGAVAVVLVLPALFGHRGTHAVLNLLVPGAGLYGDHWAIGVAFTLIGIAATIAWLRWGLDWLLAGAVLLAMGVSAALAGSGAVAGAGSVPLAHEFPLVVLVAGALSWLSGVAGRLPLVRRIVRRRQRRAVQLRDLAPVMRCRAAAFHALADVADGATADNPFADSPIAESIVATDVRLRARRVGLFARARFGGDPLRRDHAHARAALALFGRLGNEERTRFRDDAHRAWAGVPCSEPGWIRPLDATLAALALPDDPGVGERWADTIRSSLPLRRGHRPAWIWAPLGVAAGAAPAWEHAAFTALGRAAGWIDTDDDWTALRQRALGAAARGVGDVNDERLVAAARCWLALVDDAAAAEILARPTVRHDPLAIALDTLAARLRVSPRVRPFGSRSSP